MTTTDARTTDPGAAPAAMDRRTVLKAGFLAAVATPLAASFASRAGAADPATVGRWSAPFDMVGVAIHATLTHVGDVFYLSYIDGDPTVDHTSYAGTWNPSTGALAAAPVPYHRDFFCAGQNVLADGRVFMAGGHDHNTGIVDDPIGIELTDTYTPSTRRWTPTARMKVKRWYPTTVGLPGGRVLIFGGHQKPGEPTPTVERYDVAGNSMTVLPSSATRPVGLYPRMHLVANGKVLRSGPSQRSSYFNPATNTWTDLANMQFGVRLFGSSILLPGATRVLTVGGQVSRDAPPTGTAEIFDTAQATPAWRSTGRLTYPRILANTVNLPDGQVLILGGGQAFGYRQPVKIPELYTPATGAWRPLAAQLAGRMYHATALLLPDGRVLSAGQDWGSLATYGEIYSPPYLFKGPRPAVTSAPPTIGYGQQLAVGTPEPAAISKVTLIRPGSVTHQIDTDQRSVPLAFTAGAGRVTAGVPTNRFLLPPGYYMLFLVNRTGVPSVARWIRVG